MSESETNINGQPLPAGIWYFSKITDTDHAGYVWIVGLLMLIITVFTCFVRLQVRWGAYESDDWTLVVATLLNVFQHITVFVGLRKGLGLAVTVMSADEEYTAERVMFATQIMFVLAHSASKLSLALFIRRLFNNARLRNSVLCWMLIGLAGAWGVIAIFFLLIGCPPTHFLAPATCPGLVTRWNVVTSLDIFSELAIMVTPSYLVSSVLMKRKPKLLVGFAFGFRIIPIAFTILHMDRVHLAASPDAGKLMYLKPIIWLLALVGSSLITASIPSFKAFIQPFENVAMPHDGGSLSVSQSRTTTAFGSYLMMGRKKGSPVISGYSNNRTALSGRSGKANRTKEEDEEQMRPDHVTSFTSVQPKAGRAESLGDDSIQSWNSTEGIVRRDQWEIRRD